MSAKRDGEPGGCENVAETSEPSRPRVVGSSPSRWRFFDLLASCLAITAAFLLEPLFPLAFAERNAASHAMLDPADPNDQFAEVTATGRSLPSVPERFQAELFKSGRLSHEARSELTEAEAGLVLAFEAEWMRRRDFEFNRLLQESPRTARRSIFGVGCIVVVVVYLSRRK